MGSVAGTVNAVQEGRFQLVTDDGRVLQFMLSHRAAVEPQDLPQLQHRRARLRVDYRDSRHMISGVATRVEVEEREQ
ncbi:MAG TPA: hypothetical protein VFX06_00920 [Stellaceae bacterium]|jgi:hypothetical protein|nr:hypothetical protein [Stellaceae bacterium]